MAINQALKENNIGNDTPLDNNSDIDNDNEEDDDCVVVAVASKETKDLVEAEGFYKIKSKAIGKDNT